MSRFKRISDEIPQSIDQALFRAASQTSNEADSRREAMAREMAGYNTESAKKVQDRAWERISTASILSEQKLLVEKILFVNKNLEIAKNLYKSKCNELALLKQSILQQAFSGELVKD